MTSNNNKTVTILGINGRIGQFAAKAFIDNDWQVKGFGRENRAPFDGFEFVEGDGFELADVKRAIEGSDVVVHALNLPYTKWESGANKLNRVIIEALKGSGKTLIFSANVYNYAATDHILSPDLAPNPETAKGEIRVQMERELQEAGADHNFQVLMIRAGDFYGPDATGSWFDLAVGRAFNKQKITLMCDQKTKHSWAYLPDLGRVFEKVAAQRAALGAYENLHFAGNFVTGAEIAAAINKVTPSTYKVVGLPWSLFQVLGHF